MPYGAFIDLQSLRRIWCLLLANEGLILKTYGSQKIMNRAGSP